MAIEMTPRGLRMTASKRINSPRGSEVKRPDRVGSGGSGSWAKMGTAVMDNRAIAVRIMMILFMPVSFGCNYTLNYDFRNSIPGRAKTAYRSER
jgi:hypothetical protein